MELRPQFLGYSEMKEEPPQDTDTQTTFCGTI